MKDSIDPIARAISIAVIGVCGFFLLSLTLLMVVPQRSVLLAFDFNPFALFSLASLVSALGALVLILRIRQRTDVLAWFSVFLASLVAWAAVEAVTRMSSTPEMASFWLPWVTLCSSLMPLALFMFALAYTNPHLVYQPFLLPSLLSAAVFTVFLSSIDIVMDYDPTALTAVPWGYLPKPGSALGILSGWFFVLTLAVIILLWRFRKRTIDPTIRRQTNLFLMALIIPMVGGALSDGLMPILKLTIVPPLVVTLFTVTGVIICYGIMRYRVFRFTPSQVATQILDTMNEAVVGLDLQFKMTYANAGAQQLLGLNAAKLSGRQLSSFLGSGRGAAKAFQDQVSHVLREGNFGVIPVLEFQRRGQADVTAQLSVTRLNDESQPYGYLVVMTDITATAKAAELVEQQVQERTHELHEEQAKLRASIEGLPLGFVLLDQAGKAVIQNGALRQIFGTHTSIPSLEQLQERLVDFDLAKQCRQVLRTGKPFELKDVGMGGKVLHLYVGPVTATEGRRRQVIGTVVLVQDITEEQILARSKDEFFSIASHELRTPLTAIRGNASMLMQFYVDMLKDKDVHDMVYDIHESSTRLIDIVNDFLDISRLEQGKTTFDLTEVALDEVIENVIYEMRAMLQEKHLTLDYNRKTLGVIPKVWADKNRLKQIVYNLVGNAAKFTEKGGITIAADQEGSLVKVRITDTGRGISPEGQQLLFHKFQQAGESLLTRDTTRGTGLGLYISKMLTENMGGHIALESSVEGQGSVFSFTVPLAAGQAARAKTGQKATDSQTGLSVNPTELAANILVKAPVETAVATPTPMPHGRLLVVEDDPYVVRLYERIFNTTPIELQTARDGQAGLKLAREFKPDLILLDVMMPVMNGLEMLTKLKSGASTKHIPVFMLSNLGEEGTVREAMDKGAIAYLIKSDYSPEQIRDKVMEKLRQRESSLGRPS
jgi:PAS domain S-box-containing protein